MLEVLLDPRIELLSVIDMLDAGRKPAFAPPPHAYSRAVERAFAPFKAHHAVMLNAKLAKTDRDGSRRKDALLKRGAPADLVFDESMGSNRGNDERSGELEPWLEGLRDFARASRFMDGFAQRAGLLEPALAELRARAAKADWIGKLERYAGEPYEGRYTLIASPLCRKGEVLNRVWNRDDGTGVILSIVKLETGPSGSLTFVDNDLDACVWHELAHGILDLTVNLYDGERGDVPLDLGPELRRNCRNWLHGLREHLVRAVMLRLIALDRGEVEAENRLSLEEFSAEPYLKAFVDRLREYEKSREDYPTLSDFYPRLVEVFPRPAPAPPTVAASSPFYTPGQRAAALRRLDRLLLKSNDARLLASRAALS